MEMADVIRESEPLQKRSFEQMQNKSSNTFQEDVIRLEVPVENALHMQCEFQSTFQEDISPQEDLQESLPKPIVLSETTSYSGAIGSTMVLQCQIKGDADTVLWKKRTEVEESYTDIEIDNKKYIGGSTESPSLVLVSMGELDVGTYVCLATNSGGITESSEIKVSVTDTIHNNVSVLPAMFNEMLQIAKKESAKTMNIAIFQKVQNSVIGNDGLIVNQGPSDCDSKTIMEVIAERSRAAKLVAERYVEAYGKITAFNILSEPDIREVKVQFTADDEEDPYPNLQQILQKQISKALNVDARIVNIELIKHCIIVSFDITGALLPWEMSALSLAERFCNGLKDGSICLTNESGTPLSIRMESTNIQVKTSSEISDAEGVPIVSIGQGGYIATAGGITILTCTTLSSTPISTVKWYRINKEGNKEDAIKIDNKKYYGGSIQAPSLVINHTDDSDGGLYLCRAENKNGIGKSRPTYLLVCNDDDSQLFVNAFRSLCSAGTPQSDTENPSVANSPLQQSQQHKVDREAESSQGEIQKTERHYEKLMIHKTRLQHQIAEKLKAEDYSSKRPQNIGVIGTQGVGKSSLINTFVRVLSDTDCHECKMTQNKSEHVYSMTSIPMESYMSINPELCYPTFIDINGFQDDDSIWSEGLLRLVIEGRLPSDESIGKAADIGRHKGVHIMMMQYSKVYRRRRLDVLLFVTSAVQNVPERLARCVMNASQKRYDSLPLTIYGVVAEPDLVHGSEVEDIRRHMRRYLKSEATEYHDSFTYMHINPKENERKYDVTDFDIRTLQYLGKMLEPMKDRELGDDDETIQLRHGKPVVLDELTHDNKSVAMERVAKKLRMIGDSTICSATKPLNVTAETFTIPRLVMFCGKWFILYILITLFLQLSHVITMKSLSNEKPNEQVTDDVLTDTPATRSDDNQVMVKILTVVITTWILILLEYFTFACEKAVSRFVVRYFNPMLVRIRNTYKGVRPITETDRIDK